MSFNCKCFKWVLILLLCIVLRSSYLSADYNLNTNILHGSDAKIYRELFKLQSKQIKSKKSRIWKKINKLKHQINNKILIGTLDADKYLHPTGWRSSYKELKN